VSMLFKGQGNFQTNVTRGSLS